MHLNLAERNPTKLLSSLQSAFTNKDKHVNIDLLGPGLLLHDTALMLYDEIRNRPKETKVHIHSRTCLFDRAILLWLAGDSRSMRSDSWIQLSPIPDTPPCGSKRDGNDYPSSINIEEEEPTDTDLRTIIDHLEEWLPVHEIAGLRLFQSDLQELGLLDTAQSLKRISAFFEP